MNGTPAHDHGTTIEKPTPAALTADHGGCVHVDPAMEVAVTITMEAAEMCALLTAALVLGNTMVTLPDMAGGVTDVHESGVAAVIKRLAAEPRTKRSVPSEARKAQLELHGCAPAAARSAQVAALATIRSWLPPDNEAGRKSRPLPGGMAREAALHVCTKTTGAADGWGSADTDDKGEGPSEEDGEAEAVAVGAGEVEGRGERDDDGEMVPVAEKADAVLVAVAVVVAELVGVQVLVTVAVNVAELVADAVLVADAIDVAELVAVALDVAVPVWVSDDDGEAEADGLAAFSHSRCVPPVVETVDA